MNSTWREPFPSAGPAAPAQAGAARPLDVIFIEGFVGQTIIGIYDGELHEPQPVGIDLYAGVERARACDTDRIGDTIDYGVVHERLHRLLREHRVQLLEAFAETIADILIHEFGARWVRVKVTKPRKFGDVQAVGVQIERQSTDADTPRDRRSPGPARHAAVLQLIGSGMVPGKR
ncbi:dihydroneopterin aldolase [Ideonella sp. DXS29W]|uniref:dihydroneopterin aldolase n=1 Tax=Ideonella lacteola TaxID=2984193 RepID=A0ABU9BJM6_9BURK